MASPEPLVQLPAKQYRTTRLLRLAVFSLVVSALSVSVFLVAFRFLYNELVIPITKGAEYTTHVPLVLLSIVLIAFVFGRLLWDAAEGRVAPPRKKTAK